MADRPPSCYRKRCSIIQLHAFIASLITQPEEKVDLSDPWLLDTEDGKTGMIVRLSKRRDYSVNEIVLGSRR